MQIQIDTYSFSHSRRCILTKVFIMYLVTLIATLSGVGCQSVSQRPMGNRYVMPSNDQLSMKSCDPKRASQSWAVVAGINFYQDERIPDLEGAVDDAWNFYHYLVSPKGARLDPQHVKLLLNEQATRAGVEDALGQFLSASCPQDKVIIYFAGHGAPEPSRPEEAFLLVHDTSLDSMVSSAISMSQLPKFLEWRTGSTSQLLMLVDACHSGNIMVPNARGVNLEVLGEVSIEAQESKRAQAVNTTLAEMVKGQSGWGAISAAASTQKAGESGGLCRLGGKTYSGGVFTCALLESLDGRADKNRDEALSLDEVFNHLSARVVEMRRLNQIPQRSGNMNGDDLILPTIKQSLELPKVPIRYLREAHPRPYQPWLYSSLTLTGAALVGGIAMNVIANQSAQQANRYTATAPTQLSGPQGYELLDEQYQSDRSVATQLYLSAAILSAVTSTLFALDQFHQPEGEPEVYRQSPHLILKRADP